MPAEDMQASIVLTEWRASKPIIRKMMANMQARGLVVIEAKKSFSFSRTISAATSTSFKGLSLRSGRNMATTNPTRKNQGVAGRYARSARIDGDFRIFGSTRGSAAKRSASQPTRTRNS